jgi:putative spermidine/putrescine transport system ATP-binding protein
MSISSPGPALAAHDLVKRFGSVAAVDDVSFDVPGGAFLSLLGPSGSGKTTVLRLLGGFEQSDAGRMNIGGAEITDLPPYKRDIGVVFQRYALFPHMTVADNVAFPLKQRGRAGGTTVDEILETVGLPGLGARFPHELSGGQQQRVALARALVFRPRILLMDEPLAALDKHLREHLQLEIRALQQRLGMTTIYVTHDQAEAFVMSDLVAVMNAGKVEQIGPPRALYDAPRTAFVAQFVGDSNLFRGTPAGSGALKLATGDILRTAQPSAPQTLLVRPEKISLNAAAPAGNALRGVIAGVRFLGEATVYRVQVADMDITVRASGAALFGPGTEVVLSWDPADTVVIP